MLQVKGPTKWGTVRELIDRGIDASNKGNENTVEFVKIVKDVQKVVYLYGDEFLESLPQSSRKQTLGLFGLNKEVIRKTDTEKQASKAKLEFLKLTEKVYQTQTLKFIYDKMSKARNVSERSRNR